MSGRIGVWLMRSLAWMPLPWLRGLGAFLGRVLFVLAAGLAALLVTIVGMAHTRVLARMGAKP